MLGTPNSAISYSWAAVQDYTGIRTVTPLPWSSSSQSLNIQPYTLFVTSYQFSTRYSDPPVTSSFSSYSNPFISFKRKVFYKNQQHSGKRFPVRLDYVQQAITAYPKKAKYIMMSIPSPVPCNYMFTIEYKAEHALDYQPVEVRLRLGFIGQPGSVNWSSTWKCSSNSYSGTRKWV